MIIKIFGYCLSMASLISSIGLLFDMVVAVIIFRFGLPENISRSGSIYFVVEQIDEAEYGVRSFYNTYVILVFRCLKKLRTV